MCGIVKSASLALLQGRCVRNGSNHSRTHRPPSPRCAVPKPPPVGSRRIPLSHSDLVEDDDARRAVCTAAERGLSFLLLLVAPFYDRERVLDRDADAVRAALDVLATVAACQSVPRQGGVVRDLRDR